MTKLMTASLGPEDRGRGYGVLRHTLDDRFMARHGALLGDFSLALAAWADLAAASFAALFPLDGANTDYALCRAGYLGRAELGTVAVGNVLIVPEAVLSALDWRSHLLLAAVPDADGSPFGHERLDLSRAPLRQGTPKLPPIASFGLEWRDHVIELGKADPEQVLAAALDSISPSIQRVRVKGWSTSSALAVSGAFDPGAAFQLVLQPAGQPVGTAFARHQFAKLRNGQIEGSSNQEPDAWRAWTAISSAIERFESFPRAAWNPEDQYAPIEHVVALALLQAALPLEPKQRIALIAQAVSRATTPDDLRPWMLLGAGEALARIIHSAGSASVRSAYLESALGALGSGEADAAMALVAAAPLPELLEGLSNRGREAMIESGGLAVLADAKPDWRGTATPAIKVLIEACSRRMTTDRQARRLSAPLLNELSTRGPTCRSEAIAALSARLRAPSGPDDVELATPPIAAVAPDLPPMDRRAYFNRALFPILRGEAAVGRASLLDGLKAAVSLA